MRDGIICHFYLFDLHQTVQEIKDGEIKDLGVIETKDLGKAIGKYCLKNNINYIHLYGDKLYAQKIIGEIDKETKNLYSDNKLEIEVN